MKKTIMALMAVGLSLTFQSCLHDDTDLFDGKSPAERLEEAVTESKQLLESADNGWMLHYYYGQDYSGGGFTYLCKFSGGKAEVSGDLFSPAYDVVSPTTVARSSYNVTEDQGPVLSFDTNNQVVHFLAQAYQDDIDGDQGDYEFIIMRTTQDSIYLKGKKWGNKVVMTRNASDFNWQSYLENIHKVVNSMSYFYNITRNGEKIGTATLDAQSRHAVVKVGNDSINRAFYMTEDGIQFQSEVKAGDVAFNSLQWNNADKSMTSADAPSVKFEGYVPDHYMTYSDWQTSFAGYGYLPTSSGDSKIQMKFDLTSDLSSYRVTSSMEYSCKLSLSAKLSYDMYAYYDKTTGHVSFPIQRVLDPTEQYPYLMVVPCATKNDGQGEYYEFNTSGCLDMMVTDDKQNGVFTWNGAGSKSVPVNSLIFLACDSSGNLVTEDESAVPVLIIKNFENFEHLQ